MDASPALPDDNSSGLCRRATAELHPEHLGQLVAPVAGGAPLLLGSAVGWSFLVVIRS